MSLMARLGGRSSRKTPIELFDGKNPVNLAALGLGESIVLAFDPVTATTPDNSTTSPVATSVKTVPVSVEPNEVDAIESVKLTISGSNTCAVHIALVAPDATEVRLYDYDGGWDYNNGDYDPATAGATVRFTLDPNADPDDYIPSHGPLTPDGVYYLYPAIIKPILGAKLDGEWTLKIYEYGDSDASGPISATVTAEVTLRPAGRAQRIDPRWLPANKTLDLSPYLAAGCVVGVTPIITRIGGGQLAVVSGQVRIPPGVASDVLFDADRIDQGIPDWLQWFPNSALSHITDVYVDYVETPARLLYSFEGRIKKLSDNSILSQSADVSVPLEGISYLTARA